jgi:hypothetical protein
MVLWEAFVTRFEDALAQYRRRCSTGAEAGGLLGISGRHFRRLCLRYKGGRRSGRRVVSASITTAFARGTTPSKQEPSGAGWPISSAPSWPNSPPFSSKAETDVLAFMSFPKDHRPKIHSTNPLERPIGEIKRRTEVIGVSPQRGRLHPPRRRLLRAERRMGRAAPATGRWKPSPP